MKCLKLPCLSPHPPPASLRGLLEREREALQDPDPRNRFGFGESEEHETEILPLPRNRSTKTKLHFGFRTFLPLFTPKPTGTRRHFVILGLVHLLIYQWLLPALSPFFFRACLVLFIWWWGHTLGSSSRSVCCACAPVCVTTHDRLCTPAPDEQVLPLITFAHHVVGVSA